jgi:hypothetical protein
MFCSYSGKIGTGYRFKLCVRLPFPAESFVWNSTENTEAKFTRNAMVGELVNDTGDDCG